MQVLIVRAGALRCGLLARDVVEVLHAVRISTLPGAPASVEGVIDVRGELMAVVDLRSRFGLGRRAVTPEDRLVIVRTAGRPLALRVDHADELAAVPAEHLTEAGAVVADPGYATSIARLPDGLAVICDLPAFLSSHEAVLIEEALAGTGKGERSLA